MPSNSRTAVPLSANCTCRIICLSSAYVIQVSASGMTIWRKYSALLPGIQHFRLCRLRCRPFSRRQDLPPAQCPRLRDFRIGQGDGIPPLLFKLIFEQRAKPFPRNLFAVSSVYFCLTISIPFHGPLSTNLFRNTPPGIPVSGQ